MCETLTLYSVWLSARTRVCVSAPSCVCVQVYYSRSLAIVYIEHTVLQRFHDLTRDEDTPADLRPVLQRLCCLYGLWSLNNHMATLYQGQY